MSDSLLEILSQSCLNRKIIDDVVEQIVKTPQRFTELCELTEHTDLRTAHHAWWVCEKLSYQWPQRFTEERPALIRTAMETTHQGIRRNVLNILLRLPLPEPRDTEVEAQETEVRFLNFCLDGMFDPQFPPAVQALFIKLAYAFCIREPELRQEFLALLEYAELEYYTPAVVSTVRHICKTEKRNAEKSIKKKPHV